MNSEELLTRGVADVVPQPLARQKLENGTPLRIYFGIDPTGARLHLGHSVPLRKLKAFQEAGHQTIFLIGSYTAMIGDPTGRDTMREPLTKEQVMKNFETYKEQAGKILDFSKVEIRYNHEWLDTLSAADSMKIASNFTVQQMLQRDMFKERLKNEEDLSPMEFMYPILQGYDSVILDVDFEIGGNDQLFNMLCGRKLQQRYGKRDKCVLTTKLIEGTDGRKMSKTYDNCIWLEDTADDMYGKAMSIKDELMVTYFECCTNVPMAEIETLRTSLESSAIEEAGQQTELTPVNPKDLKMRLAREIVTLYHGADAAAEAEANFQSVFAKKGVPEDILTVNAAKGSILIDILAEHKLVASKSEARRLVEQQGIHVGEEPVTDIQYKIGDGQTPEAWASGVVVKVGKRRFVKIISA